MSAGFALDHLVVGTGRSGTVFLAKLLTSVGLPCSHERIFCGGDVADAQEILAKSGGSNSDCSAYFGLGFNEPPVAEASYMVVPFLEHELLQNCTIIHVVRDPLRVISSFLNNILFFREESPEFLHPQESFIRRHLPQLERIGDAASRAGYYYLRWNQMIQESAGSRRYFRYRIEDDPRLLLDFLGVRYGDGYFNEPTNLYSQWPEGMRKETDLPRISDEEIMCSLFWKEVATLASQYGYTYSTKFSPQLNRVYPVGADSRSAGAPARRATFYSAPRLVEEDYRGYNLVDYRRTIYAVARDLGPLDLAQLSAGQFRYFRFTGRLYRGGNLQEAKRWIDRAVRWTWLRNQLLRFERR